MPLVIGGRTVSGPKTVLLVLPREPEDIVFKFVSVLDDDEFLALYPEPRPRRQTETKTGKTVLLTEENQYKKAWAAWNKAKTNWFFLKSIEPSHVEWQTVDMLKPDTYDKWQQELHDAGFSFAETNTIWQKFESTNVLTEKMLEEARLRFLASLEVGSSATQSSPTSEPENTESSELAKD